MCFLKSFEVQLIYNSVLVSSAHQRDSASHTTHTIFFLLLSIQVHCKTLTVAPWALQQDLTVCLLRVLWFVPASLQLLICPSPLPSAFGSCKSVFCVCGTLHVLMRQTSGVALRVGSGLRLLAETWL